MNNKPETKHPNAKGAIFVPKNQIIRREIMYQRNFKNNKTISTYPCNTGYVTEMSDQYGRRIKEIFSYTIEEARQQHRRYLSYA